MIWPPPRTEGPLIGAAADLGEPCFVVVAWSCFSVASFFVLLRLIVRFRHNRSLFPDDYWMILAWLCFTTMLICQMMQSGALYFTTYYYDDNSSLEDTELLANAEQLLRWQYPVTILFFATLWSVKASFLATFYRLVYPLRWARWAWWIILFFTIGGFFGSLFAMVFICGSPGDFFTPGECQSPGNNPRHVFAISFSTGLDVATDLTIVVLSLAVLRTLRFDRSKKLGVAAAFSLVVAIIVVSMVRLEMVLGDHSQVDLVGLAVWGIVETMTALVVGSVMPLSGLLSKLFRKVGSARSKTRSKRSGQSSRSSDDMRQQTPGRDSGSQSGLIAPQLPPLYHVAQRNGSVSTGAHRSGSSYTFFDSRDDLSIYEEQRPVSNEMMERAYVV